MEALSFNNDHQYNIIVMAEDRGYPDDQTLLIPQFSINWNFIISYRPDTDIVKISRITDHNTRHQVKLPSHEPLTSHDISNMISGIRIPFPLHRLRWKKRFETNTEPLEISFDDMLNQIICVANDMVHKASLLGRKMLDMLVTVEKQIKLPHREYEAKVRATKEEDMLRSLNAMHSLMSSYNNPNLVFRCLDEIESSAAASGLNVSRENIMGYAMEQVMRESLHRSAAEFKSKPATKASVEALKKLTLGGHGGSSTVALTSEMCSVCREEMLSGSQVTCLPCSHMFHEGCIVEWFNWGHMCPVCRFKLPTEA